MSVERKKILEMLAAGKISADEAEKLMEKLEDGSSASSSGTSSRSEVRSGGARAFVFSAGGSGDGDEAATSSAPTATATASRSGGDRPRYLRIVVESSDGDNVNIRIPLKLVRTGLALSTMVPKDANEKLHDHGVDLSKLSQLNDEEIIQAIRDLKVDVDSSDGDKVRIFCE